MWLGGICGDVLRVEVSGVSCYGVVYLKFGCCIAGQWFYILGGGAAQIPVVKYEFVAGFVCLFRGYLIHG